MILLTHQHKTPPYHFFAMPYYFGLDSAGKPRTYASKDDCLRHVCGKTVKNDDQKSGIISDVIFFDNEGHHLYGWPRSIIIEFDDKIIVGNNNKPNKTVLQMHFEKAIGFRGLDFQSGQLEHGYFCAELGLVKSQSLRLHRSRSTLHSDTKPQIKPQIKPQTDQTKTQRIIEVNQMQKKLSTMRSNLQDTAKSLETCIEKHFNQQMEAIDKILKMTHSFQTKIQDDTLSFKDQYIKQHELPEMSDENFTAWFLQTKDPPDQLKMLAEELLEFSKENSKLTQENATQHREIEHLKLKIEQQRKILKLPQYQIGKQGAETDITLPDQKRPRKE